MGVDLDTGIYVRDPRFIPTIDQLRGVADILKTMGVIDEKNHHQLVAFFSELPVNDDGTPRIDEYGGEIEIAYTFCHPIPGLDGVPRMVINTEISDEPSAIPSFAIAKVDQEGWSDESIELVDLDLQRGQFLAKLKACLGQYLGQDIIAAQSDGESLLHDVARPLNIDARNLIRDRIRLLKNASEELKQVLKFFYTHPVQQYHHLVLFRELGFELAKIGKAIWDLEAVHVLKRMNQGFQLEAGAEFVCPWCGHIQFVGDICEDCGELLPTWQEPVPETNIVEIMYMGAFFGRVRIDAIEFLRKNEDYPGDLDNLPDFTGFEGLDKLSRLKCLRLNMKNVARIAFPHPFPTVEILDMESNLVARIENLGDLPNLKHLNLSFNRISRIEGLESLSHLESLNLSANRIERIEGLDALRQLKHLNLRVNKHITRIEGLDQLVNLERLNLVGCQIERIEGLDQLVRLKDLRLEYNRIHKIEHLDQLVNLERLDLGGWHAFFTLEGLGALKHLKALHFHECFPEFPKTLIEELGGFEDVAIDRVEWRALDPQAFVEYCERNDL